MANFGENERELVGQTYVDKSGTITTGGTAQTLMTASTDANGRFVYNPNASGSLWVNVLGGTAAANGVATDSTGQFIGSLTDTAKTADYIAVSGQLAPKPVVSAAAAYGA